MTTPVIAAWVAGVVVVLVVIGWLSAHNHFVRQRQQVQESWRDVDVELRRRHELVPALVQVVTAYAAHERALLEALSRERGALGGRVAAVALAYPELRADALYLDLHRQLVETEARLAAARRIHLSNVQAYNTRVQSVPTSLVARAGGFEPELAVSASESASPSSSPAPPPPD